MSPLGIRTGADLRTLDERRMVEQLMLCPGHAYDLREGRAEAARAEAAAALERWVGLGLGFESGADGERRVPIRSR